MAKRGLAGSQFIPRELLKIPDIQFSANVKHGFTTSLKLTGYKPRDFGRDLNKAVKSANQLIANKLATALDEAMASTAWGGGKDIIDTGELKNSLVITATSGGVTVKYTAPYAAIIHYGGYILPYGNPKLSKVYIPPRPWVSSVMKGGGPVPAFDFESVYREAIQAVFG
jgi:phage gpG-like protein